MLKAECSAEGSAAGHAEGLAAASARGSAGGSAAGSSNDPVAGPSKSSDAGWFKASVAGPSKSSDAGSSNAPVAGPSKSSDAGWFKATVAGWSKASDAGPSNAPAAGQFIDLEAGPSTSSTKEKVIHCGICTKQFWTQKAHKTHRCNFPCDDCDQTFPTFRDLILHMDKEENKNVILCQSCAVFCSHRDFNKSICNACIKSTEFNTNLNLPLKDEHVIHENFVCHACKDSFFKVCTLNNKVKDCNAEHKQKEKQFIDGFINYIEKNQKNLLMVAEMELKNERLRAAGQPLLTELAPLTDAENRRLEKILNTPNSEIGIIQLNSEDLARLEEKGYATKNVRYVLNVHHTYAIRPMVICGLIILVVIGLVIGVVFSGVFRDNQVGVKDPLGE